MRTAQPTRCGRHWKLKPEGICNEICRDANGNVNAIAGSFQKQLTAVLGGERQRISIARAFLKDAPIILLDEATASLDKESETAIQEALSRLIKDKTVLIIAHRMRTASSADKIVMLKDGAVAEQGSPEQLLHDGGIFDHMVQLQTKSQGWSLVKA